MAVTLSGSTGALFNRLGKLGAWHRTVNGARGETAPYGTVRVNYVDVLAATTSAKATQVDLTAAMPFTVLGIVQPDVPRNIVYNFTDANSSISAISVTTVGIAPDGSTVTEQVTQSTAADLTGSVIFQKITSITVNSVTGAGAGDLLDIGHGGKIGVSTPVNSSGFTVTSLLVDGVSESASATDTTNKSFTPTTAPNGTRDYDVTVAFTTGETWGSSGGKIKDAKTCVTDVLAQYASNEQQLMDGLWGLRDSQISSASSTLSSIKDLASRTIIEQVHRDAVLTSKDITSALRELFRQMTSSNDDVNANTVSAGAASAASTNTGNATIIASVVGPDGKNREYIYAENIEVTVTDDNQGGATAGSEPCSVVGEVAANDTMAYDAPDGSGASTSLTIINASLDEDGNLLTNSDFDAFTSNVPDGWTVLVGSAGTDILEETSTVYRSGGKALEFVGTGGTPLSSVCIEFDSGALEPNTVYAVNMYARKSAGLAAGAVQLRLIDGTNTTINDDAGTANAVTVAHGTLTGSFAAYNGFFRTPKVLPSTIKFNARVSTALTNAESVFIDDVAMCEAVEAYPGGPYVAAFRGSTESLKNDKWTITIANDYGGVFQSLLMAWFRSELIAAGLQCPSDTGGAETCGDSLVT